MIALDAAGWRLEVLPELGGSIGRLAFEGDDILRAAPSEPASVLDTACFPLVPFANRVAGAAFTFGGREHRLKTLPQFHPHALHGDAWLEPWTVTGEYERSLTLQYRSGEGWPWPYVARQTITLDRRRMEIDLQLTNAGATAMPAGLGLHPYFPRRAATRLSFSAANVWLGDPGGIPQAIGPAGELVDFARSVPLADAPFLDHCYAAWRGEALIADPTRTIAITATANASWAHLFIPPDADFFCFEPVTHRPDALNAPEDEDSGLAILRPGESMAMGMTIVVPPG